jgi:uncharacterized iron-regulated membrane protein
MRTFKFFWNAHKWTGLTLAIIFACTACTGFLLIIKKRATWIQPPTVTGAPGSPEQFISTQQLFAAVLAHEHPDFISIDDVDRVDFRPGDRTFKVISRHNYSEVQVCAISGEVLSIAWRPSDLIEDLHDGSYLGGWFHEWVMPVVACGLLFLVCSGLWLWIEPFVRRRTWRKARAI